MQITQEHFIRTELVEVTQVLIITSVETMTWMSSNTQVTLVN